MKKITFTYLSIFASVLIYNSAFAQKTDDVLGIWWNEEKDGKVEIYKCNNKYCGKLIWLKEPNDEKGQPKTDTKNSDNKLKARKLFGLQIMNSFEYGGKNIWEDGKIYDPKKGQTYSCKMTLKDKNTLDVRGYIGISLVGRTTTWTRAQ